MRAARTAESLFLLAALLLVTTVCHAGNEPIPVGRHTTAEVSAKGTWCIKHRGITVVQELGIGVWDGAGSFTGQEDSTAPKIDSRQGRSRTEGILGKNLLSYRTLVSRCSGGLHFRWRQVDPTKNRWAVIMKLPLKLFEGVDFILDGQHTHTFPADRGRAPRFFTGNAQSLLTARTQGARLFLDCTRPYGLVAQDARKWGDSSYHVLLYPKEGEISFLLSLSSLKGGPAILHASENSRKIGTFEKFELTLDLWAQFKNPYDRTDVSVVAEVTRPSGRSVRLDGFIYREFLRATEEGKERFEPAGEPTWKVRYTPSEIGRHTYSLTVRSRRGVSAPLKGEFMVTDSKRHGFLKVADGGKSFEFRDGAPYFAVGHNLCWTSEDTPLADYEAYLRKMSRAGENFSRIWLSSWGIGLETDTLENFDLADAWMLDQVVQIAEKRGVFFKLCLENFWDFTKEKKSPYWTERGGFCKENRDYFAKAESKEWAKRKYRYAVARWGYSPAILAWELWNEVDYAVTDKELILEWTREIATYLRSVDPYGHMITTSLGVNNVWEDLWKMPQMDFVQIHSYIRRLESQITLSERDAAKLILEETARVRHLGKPCLVSEFGYLVTKDDAGMNDVDENGVHLHNALWASALSGAAGTCMSWWWDSYIEKHGLYHQYKALAEFLRGETERMGSLTHVYGESESKSIRVVGLRDSRGGLFWMQNKHNTWFRCVAKRERFLPLREAILRLSGLEEGRYLIEWWNTHDGGMITKCEKTVGKDGVLKARAPAAASDIGCKVKLLPPEKED
jgi:hypothetical protein